jgi:cell pole-organizing protein PopZ
MTDNNTETANRGQMQESGADISTILKGIKEIVENGESDHDSTVLVLTEKVEGQGSVAVSDNLAHEHRDILAEIDKEANIIAPEGLVSPSVSAAVQASISQILRPQTEYQACIAEPSFASKSLEEVVISILKQELQMWLNKNLEPMVREILEKEIRKIVRK